MLGLSFLSPWFLLGLAAAAGPLLLHLFSRENAPLTVLPTTRFVPRVPVEQTRRRRLQDIWLLLLRLAALLVLAVAFARPYFAGPDAAARQVVQVLAVDRSFSMAGTSREAATQQVARDVVNAMPPGAPAALVAFDHEASVVVEPTASRGALIEQLERLRPGQGATNIASALRAAVDLAQGRPARLVVVTDGQVSGADREAWPDLPATLDVAFRTVAAAPDNVSIGLVERQDGGLTALVRNHGLSEARTRVRWMVDGREVAASMVDLPANGAIDTRLARSVPDRAAVSVVVDDGTGYAADNARFLVTDPPRAVPVLLVTSVDGPREAGLYFRAALEAVDAREGRFAVTQVAADDPRLAGSDLPVSARVIAIVGTRGLERKARVALAAAVGGGRGLFIAAGPSVEPGVVREVLGRDDAALVDAPANEAPQHLAATDVRHPVLAALGSTAGNLGQVRVETLWNLRELPGSTALIRFSSGGPALLELHPGRGRALVLMTDVGRRWNTWPLHPTFVPFVVEATRFLAGERPSMQQAIVGDPSIPGDGSRAGVVRVAGAGDAGARVAVNVDPRESRVEALTADELSGRLRRMPLQDQSEPSAADVEGSQELWRSLVWVVLGILTLEALLASRHRRHAEVTGLASEGPREVGERA